MTDALLLIDIQNDYFPGGRMEVEGALTAARACATLLSHFRERGRPVFHIRHLSVRPGAGFLLENTEGSLIHSLVEPVAGEVVLVKNFPNSFRGTTLDADLKRLGVDHLTVCGMMTHMCVDTTVRAAFDLGYRLTLAVDGCATRSLAHDGVSVGAGDVQRAYLAALGGVFARLATASGIAAS